MNRRAWLLVVLAGLALLPPSPAVAQSRDESPSARELWQAYPLHPSPEPAQAATPTSAPTRGPSGGSSDTGSSQATLSVAVAAVLAVIAFGAGFALTLRPFRRDSKTVAAPEPNDSAETASRAWTAEIEWCPDGGEAYFRAVARDAEGTPAVVVAQSARLPWPPSNAEAVSKLASAAEELEDRLVAAGWRPLAAGDAWYAKRFAWEPVASTLAPGTRFERHAAWPENTQRLWRCEVELDTGPGDARFRAVARRPGGRPGPTIDTATDVRDLATSLLAAGWEPAGTGADWYSERFVWRREGSPLDHVAPMWTHSGRAT